jgi:hypothetical protein
LKKIPEKFAASVVPPHARDSPMGWVWIGSKEEALEGGLDHLGADLLSAAGR